MAADQQFPPELRKDPITGIWVIIADRGGRPSGKLEERELPPEGCPFCPGNEHMTPPEIYAVRPDGGEANGPGWQIRVVPNRFKALDADMTLVREGVGMYDKMSGCGAHEVIIETPDHYGLLCSMPRDQVVRVLETYRARLEDLRRDPRFRHVIVFRNYRLAAGASLRHPHSQVIALPIVPKLVKDKLISALEHFRSKERCIFCDVIRQEMYDAQRIVAQNEHFIAIVPFAARFPYETHIYPLRHCYDFVLIHEEEVWTLAAILQDVLARFFKLFGEVGPDGHERNVPYNIVLQTAPNTLPRPGHPEYWGTIEYDYHWHIEIIPRLSRVAGFEWGTGFYINSRRPEEAAHDLRTAFEREEAPQKVH